MSGTRDAQRYFDAGVLSLGLAIDGLETDRDEVYATLAFRNATVCETTSEVIYHLSTGPAVCCSASNAGRGYRPEPSVADSRPAGIATTPWAT